MTEASVTPAQGGLIEEVLAQLAAGPPRIEAATTGVAPVRLHTAPDHDAWSANEVLAHLRACADVWGDCMAVILADDRPTIRAVSPRTWITRTDYLDLDFGTSLRSFAAQRADLLARLAPLPEDAWSRGAKVIGAGRTLERTVLSYAQWLASHERPHLTQIERAVSR